jgi:hypothetical protein
MLCSGKFAKRYGMLTLAYRASKQLPPSWGNCQDLYLLMERSQVRASVQVLLPGL